MPALAATGTEEILAPYKTVNRRRRRRRLATAYIFVSSQFHADLEMRKLYKPVTRSVYPFFYPSIHPSIYPSI